MKKHLLLAFLLFICSYTFAQPAGEVDLNFNPSDKGYGIGVNNYVVFSAIQNDGKTLLAGGFSAFLNNRANGLVRLNIDGTFDSSFKVDTQNTNINKTIYSINILSNNKIIIAGNFLDYQGSGRNYLVRLFPDGSIDSTFNPSTLSNRAIYTAILNDGKVMVAHLDGKYLSRLNEDGTLDSSFNIGTGANDYVHMISVLADNSLIITGYFDQFNGIPCYGIVKLFSNGNIDQNFMIEKINSLHDVHFVDPQGKIYIAGNFDSVGNYKRNGIARLNSNGSLDLSYDPSQYLPFYNSIRSVTGQTDGKILLAGSMNVTNPERKILVRVNIDGTLDSTFTVYNEEDLETPYHIIQTSDQKLLLSGAFNKYNNKRLGFYVRLLLDGTIDYNFHKETGVGGTVNSIEKYGSNKILIAGYFGSYNGNDSIRNIALINENGVLDTSFKANVNGIILNTIPLVTGKIMIVGEFKKVDNQLKNGIARLNADGSLDPTFNINGSGADASIQHILKLKNNSFYLLGTYRNYNGALVKGVIRISENGSLDSNFSLKPYSGIIRAMAIDSLENLYLSGTVTKYNNINCKRLIRVNVNAELDTLHNQNQASNLSDANFRKLFVMDNQKLLTVGTKNSSSPGVYLFNYDGTPNVEFNSNTKLVSNSTFNNVLKVNNNSFLISGYFTKYNNINRKCFVRIFENGILDTSFNTGNTYPLFSYALYMDNNSNYLIGGNFPEFNNVGRNGLCRVNGSYTAIGIEDKKAETIANLLYPNPSKNILNVNMPDISKYVIYNNTGQLLQSGNYSASEGIIISELSNALYILECIDKNGNRRYYRFIKE